MGLTAKTKATAKNNDFELPLNRPYNHTKN